MRELKLIAEPWDIGPGGYQPGHFPAAWGEWNDRYRDDVSASGAETAACRRAGDARQRLG